MVKPLKCWFGKHHLSNGEYEQTNKCYLISVCKDCNKKYTSWKHNYNENGKCSRCGEWKPDDKHDSGLGMNAGEVCPQCGSTDCDCYNRSIAGGLY